MKIDISEFWDKAAANRPILTQEMIAFAEESLNVKLPQLFIDLLKVQNGGYTNGFAFPIMQQTSWSANHVPLFELFGIITEKSIVEWQNSWDEKKKLNLYVEDKSIEVVQNILETNYMTKEWGLPEKQVLLTGEGHWWITLDYRGGDTPTVRWIDIECGEDLHLANSFDEFINGLVSDEEYGDNDAK